MAEVIRGSIYGPLAEVAFPFQSNFDYNNLEKRIIAYKQSGKKDKKIKKQLLRDIATSSCFKELRILLVKLLESKNKNDD